ncbi:glycine betaine ABC transporter substrate-binding protein [Brevibacillus invocatus]|uniref:glycine betaine ABC transporter substrate-binding protein n=1 Tax=Brevibacillus invocatus TaxID=173959 RepID=UPI00203AEB69|nr:glycine betaine ABC transporter substrate-binding protein [Brevibacillus invocatus]MCM3079339.1 glycine/betaine ABC transporter [Brevibacillus invocatus]MCM3429435.1 glycine/betaine ABC transporter [Brevibacillus invocatus]
MKKTIKVILAIMLGASVWVTGCSQQEASPTPSVTPPQTSTKAASTSVGEILDYKIIGIDAGSGSMLKTAEVMTHYGLDNWQLVEGSDAAMTAALTQAYAEKQPIIITGWTPHWMFKKMDLKYLEDPKNGFGGAEQIHTIVRKGLKQEHPAAYQFLDAFHWEPTDMEAVMVQILDGEKPADAASEWVKNNEEKVGKWVEGIQPVNKEKLTIAYVAWDSEIASTHVVEHVLEKRLGYEVELSQVQTGPMWAGVAIGDVDGMVAAWLPSTDVSYLKKFGGQIEDLGPNLDGTKIGLVVPAYMDITSIEDLKN